MLVWLCIKLYMVLYDLSFLVNYNYFYTFFTAFCPEFHKSNHTEILYFCCVES